MTYDPDEQDDVVGDAMAVGGEAFVRELHEVAREAAEASCPWDGEGEEPEEYRRAWIAAARTLVTDRRAQLDAEERTARRHPDRPGPDAGAGPEIGPGRQAR